VLALQSEALVQMLTRGSDARAVVLFEVIYVVFPSGNRVGAHLAAPLRDVIGDGWVQFRF